jgi:hypothetical protein
LQSNNYLKNYTINCFYSLSQMQTQTTLQQIANFLYSINIKVVEQKLPTDTFLPGLSLLGNSILIDMEQLKYPGDLLHEAGHIATTEENRRPLIGTTITTERLKKRGYISLVEYYKR